MRVALRFLCWNVNEVIKNHQVLILHTLSFVIFHEIDALFTLYNNIGINIFNAISFYIENYPMLFLQNITTSIINKVKFFLNFLISMQSNF